MSETTGGRATAKYDVGAGGGGGCPRALAEEEERAVGVDDVNSTGHNENRMTLRFLLVGNKQAEGDPFFEWVKEGCEDEAHRLTKTSSAEAAGGEEAGEGEHSSFAVECIYAGPASSSSVDGHEDTEVIAQQAEIVNQYLLYGNSTIHGIALAPVVNTGEGEGESEYLYGEILATASKAGVPVITFDNDFFPPPTSSDAATAAQESLQSKRAAYIGTEDYAFGQALGKMAVQLLPQGGTYALVTCAHAPKYDVRVRAVRDYLSGQYWRSDAPGEGTGTKIITRPARAGTGSTIFTEASTSPSYCDENTTLALQQVDAFASQQVVGDEPAVDVIIPVGTWPMQDLERWKSMATPHLSNNKTFIVADTYPKQLEAVKFQLVRGSVGELPYKMGGMCIKYLFDHWQSSESSSSLPGNSRDYDINFVEMLLFPLNLPAANVDNNYLGSQRILGFTFFGIIAALSIALIAWTLAKKNKREVVSSQPVFLVMLCFGALVFGSTLIPMSFDDSVVTNETGTLDKMCMSVPWLASLGFTIIFAALTSKIRRINKIFNNPIPYSRVKITLWDLYLPLSTLLGLNVINLATWTALAPLKFERLNHQGTDEWNRVISTYGTCTSSNAQPFLIVMVLINFTAVAIANWQAYRARSVQWEFSESKYIGIAMVIILQALLVGIPILLLVREMAQEYYTVLAVMIFVISVAILALIFLPKIAAEQAYENWIREQQRKHISKSMAEIKEKRFGYDSMHVNDGSHQGYAEDAMANRRDCARETHFCNSGWAQQMLDEDEDENEEQLPTKSDWLRADLASQDSDGDEDDGMKVEIESFNPGPGLQAPYPHKKDMETDAKTSSETYN